MIHMTAVVPRILATQKAGGGLLGIDGATNVLSKSIINIIVQSPLPIFIECLKSALQRETTGIVVGKLKDLMVHLDAKLAFKFWHAFISDSYNGTQGFRKRFVEDNIVRWMSGCVTHCLNFFSEDLGRKGFKNAIEETLFDSGTVRESNLIGKLFEVVCVEKL